MKKEVTADQDDSANDGLITISALTSLLNKPCYQFPTELIQKVLNDLLGSDDLTSMDQNQMISIDNFLSNLNEQFELQP